MKSKLITIATFCGAIAASHAGGLYQIPDAVEEPIPLTWVAAMDFIFDDNSTPTAQNDDSTLSVNPHLSVTYAGVAPQTTIDIYAKIGAIYYLDELAVAGAEDVYGQARLGFDIDHRVNDRLSYISKSFISYELEPDYSYGFAIDRELGEYLYVNIDNSVGYRWTERFATHSGIIYNLLDYEDASDDDRQSWTLYTQGRYQLTPQTVITTSYRYNMTDAGGVARDSDNHYFLLGIERSISSNTVFISNFGAQYRSIEGVGGTDDLSPYAEFSIRSRINQQFSVRGYLRYGVETFNTVLGAGANRVEYDSKQTLRLGVSGSYSLSQKVTLFGGADLIHSSFEDGRNSNGSAGIIPDIDSTLVNIYLGASVQLTDYLSARATYNFTNSDSDQANRDYDRNRISLGLHAEF